MKYKKTFIILVMSLVAILFCSCDNISQSKNSEKPEVIAVSFIQYDLTKQIAKDKIDLQMLVLPGAEVHTFEPTPMDLAKISGCDLLIRNGGESELWLDSLLSDAQNVKSLKFIDFTNNLCTQHKDSDSDSPHEHHHEIDEHVWTSPKNAILIANAICDALIEVDSENSAFYIQNKNDLIESLVSLDKEFTELTSNSQRNVIVVGDRFPFLYLANDYNLEYFAAFSGCASNTEPNASDIMALTEKVKIQNIPVVFKIEFSNGSIAKSIAESTNAKVLLLHSCHNVTKDEFEEGVGYVSLMKQNLKNLQEALN